MDEVFAVDVVLTEEHLQWNLTIGNEVLNKTQNYENRTRWYQNRTGENRKRKQ